MSEAMQWGGCNNIVDLYLLFGFTLLFFFSEMDVQFVKENVCNESMAVMLLSERQIYKELMTLEIEAVAVNCSWTHSNGSVHRYF